ncbi:ribulose-phosphate 3-epimerase [Myxococcota bacterium]|nr:ribulose-phosphate 3-epimerase [Myxococcota bacterium]
MHVQVAPSLLSADILHLDREVESIRGCDWLHIDVMDGDFVPNITYGPGLVRALSRIGIPQDVHLMISQPARHIDAFIDAGAAIVTIHAEADVHLHRTLSHLKKRGVKAGVALNPSTPVSVLEHVWDVLDLVLIMTVNPGFGGQAFIPGGLAKLAQCRQILDSKGRTDCLIEVDGGVDLTTAPQVVAAGANLLVSGSALFSAPDRGAFIRQLQNL